MNPSFTDGESPAPGSGMSSVFARTISTKALARGPFHEVWHLRINDATAQKALWLRFSVLVSENGFRKVAETWAVYSERNAQKEVTKIALKQSHGLESFRTSPDGEIRIGESHLTEGSTRGMIRSKSHTIRWDLQMTPRVSSRFNLVPETLSRTGIVRSTAETWQEDLSFNGTAEIDGQVVHWDRCHGMLGHMCGPKSPQSWVWGQCNHFTSDKGESVPFIFEGISAKIRWLGAMPAPRLSSFYFHYQGKSYYFNSLLDSLRTRSRQTLTGWEFQADRGHLSFRGKMKAELKDFAGATYEDTNGSFIYCANSQLSDLAIHVYRNGKIESSFQAAGSAAFEIVSREKNPYVPLLI